MSDRPDPVHNADVRIMTLGAGAMRYPALACCPPLVKSTLEW